MPPNLDGPQTRVAPYDGMRPVTARGNDSVQNPAGNRWTVWHDLLLASLLAVPAAGLSLSRGFDGLYGQDAYAYFDYATTSVRRSIEHLAPALETFFWPPGYPILVALASLTIGPSPLAGQVVSLAMGALVPVFTAL